MADIPFTHEQLQEAVHEFHPPQYTGFLEVDWESVRHVDGHTYHFVAKHVQGGFAGNVDSGKRSNLAVTHDGGALRVTATDA